MTYVWPVAVLHNILKLLPSNLLVVDLRCRTSFAGGLPGHFADLASLKGSFCSGLGKCDFATSLRFVSSCGLRICQLLGSPICSQRPHIFLISGNLLLSVQVLYLKLRLIHQQFLIEGFLAHLVLGACQDVVDLIWAEGRRWFGMDLPWFNSGRFVWVEVAQNRLIGTIFPAVYEEVVLLPEVRPQPVPSALTLGSVAHCEIVGQTDTILDSQIGIWSQALLAGSHVGSKSWSLILAYAFYIQGFGSSKVQCLVKFHRLNQVRWWTLSDDRSHFA